jgi:hypothetical protein
VKALKQSESSTRRGFWPCVFIPRWLAASREGQKGRRRARPPGAVKAWPIDFDPQEADAPQRQGWFSCECFLGGRTVSDPRLCAAKSFRPAIKTGLVQGETMSKAPFSPFFFQNRPSPAQVFDFLADSGFFRLIPPLRKGGLNRRRHSQRPNRKNRDYVFDRCTFIESGMIGFSSAKRFRRGARRRAASF